MTTSTSSSDCKGDLVDVPKYLSVRATNVLAAMNTRFSYLYDRWQDEKGYEDFATYEKELKKLVSPHGKFISASSSPFAVVIRFSLSAWNTRFVVRGDKIVAEFY